MGWVGSASLRKLLLKNERRERPGRNSGPKLLCARRAVLSLLTLQEREGENLRTSRCCAPLILQSELTLHLCEPPPRPHSSPVDCWSSREASRHPGYLSLGGTQGNPDAATTPALRAECASSTQHAGTGMEWRGEARSHTWTEFNGCGDVKVRGEQFGESEVGDEVGAGPTVLFQRL
jgi:hypothetical protein